MKQDAQCSTSSPGCHPTYPFLLPKVTLNTGCLTGKINIGGVCALPIIQGPFREEIQVDIVEIPCGQLNPHPQEALDLGLMFAIIAHKLIVLCR